MDKQHLRPQPAQPVYRTTTGHLPPELAELAEETLSLGAAAGVQGLGDSSSASVLPSTPACPACGLCSYDGDDAE